MQLQIRFTGGAHSRSDNEFLKEILLGQLERFRRRVQYVCLYVEDVNGPRGGPDKQCRCILHLRRLPPIVIRDRDQSITAMVHRVSDRASHALQRDSERQKSMKIGRKRVRPGIPPELL